MFLRAGALSLALLLASRLLGVVRESALAAAFGTSGLADAAVLMLTLPDWIASVLAGGALAYVLLPAWARGSPQQVAALQRQVARRLMIGAAALALALAASHRPLLQWLAAGVPAGLQDTAADGLLWSAAALPAAFLAALWATRLQHERDFAGMYGGNLVVNAALIAAIAAAALGRAPIAWLGAGLLAAMGLRLLWLGARHPVSRPGPEKPALPDGRVWAAAALAAGLPLALPFVARSAASQAGEGALATFNYAWKLVELPLVLAIQLAASLAFPAVARAFSAQAAGADRDAPVRQAFALAWVLACAAIAALHVGGPALARLLFGWGRMPTESLGLVAQWGVAGSWSLLAHALASVALTVLAAQSRMRWAVWGHAGALAVVIGAAASGVDDGFVLMHVLNAVQAGVAVICLAALGSDAVRWLPWPALIAPLGPALGVVIAAHWLRAGWVSISPALELLAATAAAAAVIGFALWRSADLRQALRR